MKRKLLATITILSFVAAFGEALADEKTEQLTIEQAVQEGLHQSPTLKKYESAKDAAHGGKLLGMSGLLPQVEVVGKHDFTARYETVPVTLGALSASVPEVFPRTSIGVVGNWTLFDGLANVNTYRASLDLSQASDLELSRKDFEVQKKIELAYFNALAAQKFEEVAEENVKTLQENLTQVRYRLESGVATQYDVLRVEVQMSDANTELERTQDNVVIERKKLSEAMGQTEDTRTLAGELPTPQLAEKIQNLGMPDVKQREDFQAAELRSEAADKEANAAKGKLIPAIGLSAQYQRYENTDYPGEAYGGFRDAWSAGFFLSWNIFDGGATVARTEIAHANAEHATNEYKESLLTLPADYELWKRRYLYSQHHFEAKKQDLQRSAESLRISMLSFQQGRKTITDVLEAETDLFRARAGVVQSQLDAEEALVKLELTSGKEI